MNKHKIVLTGMMVLLLVSLALSTSQIRAEPMRASQIFEVTTTANDGPGSLRQAITDANNNSDTLDYIYFDIPTSDEGHDSDTGVWTISLSSVLPQLNDLAGVEIHGETQAGTSPLPRVIVKATAAIPEGADLFTITGDYNKIWHLGLYNSRGDGIVIDGEYNNISNNLIFSSLHYGIRLFFSVRYNTIENNRIWGYGSGGIYLDYSNFNSITNNIIGLQPPLAALPINAGNGITLYDSIYNVIENNTIGLNSGHGIASIEAGLNYIWGNFVGLNEDLSLVKGNQGHGIYIYNGFDESVRGNWVAANSLDGIRLEGENTSSVNIEKNRIGMHMFGPAPNLHHGIGIYNGAHDNDVGSETEPDKYNYVTRNGWSGVVVVNSPIGKNSIANNYILYNQYYGVHINNSPDNDLLANVIVGNGDSGTYAGVRVENSSGLEGASHCNTIMDNRIGNNSGLGIQLVLDANHDIQKPTIFSASCTSLLGTTFIECGTSCQVQIFSDNDDEGYILEGTVTTVGAGNFGWSGFLHGPNVTATVTDAEGNTSEFSLPKVNACIRKLQYLPLIMK